VVVLSAAAVPAVIVLSAAAVPAVIVLSAAAAVPAVIVLSAATGTSRLAIRCIPSTPLADVATTGGDTGAGSGSTCSGCIERIGRSRR
jgi:hypothetical protein